MITETRSLIGIVGPTEPEHTHRLREFSRQHSEFRLLALVSAEYSENDQYTIPERLAELFPSEAKPEKEQWADWKKSFFSGLYFTTDQPETISTQLIHIMEESAKQGFVPDMILLNVPWPPTDELRSFKDAYPDTGLILKIGPDAYDKVGRIPEKLRSRLAKYRHMIESVVLKPVERSGSEEIDPLSVCELVEVLADLNFDLMYANHLAPRDWKKMRKILHKGFPGIGFIFYTELLKGDGKFSTKKTIATLNKLRDIYKGL